MSAYHGIFETTKGQRIESERRTICEAHREIYDELVVGLTGKDDALLGRVVPLLEEVFGMGIKLVDKLIEKKIDDLEFPFQYGSMPPDVKAQVENLRAERVRLTEILKGSK